MHLQFPRIIGYDLSLFVSIHPNPKDITTSLKMPIPCSKSYLGNITSPYPQLMIPGPEVDLREITNPLHLIKLIIYSRDWVLIIKCQLA